MSDRRGHIKISRKFFEDDPWWHEARPKTRAEAWLDMIYLASWKPRQYAIGADLEKLDRGEFIASIRFLAGRWHWSKSAVERWLKAVEKAGRIARQREGQGGTVYLLVNYDYYQTPETGSGTRSGTPSGTAAGHLRDKTEAVKTSKADKQTWLTPFALAWERRCGNPPHGRLAKAIAPLIRSLGESEALDRWSRYLSANEPRYCSPERFASTHHQYGGPETQEMTDDFGRMVLHRKNAAGQWEPIVA